MKLICVLLCCCVLFCGCQQAVPAEIQPTIPGDISEYDFVLPEGYAFGEDSANSLTILKDGENIGGLVLTGLDISCLEDTGSIDVHRYIDSLAPLPLICEYIIMQGDGFLSVSMAVTDPDTNVRTETSHRLFAHEGRCFDLWFNSDLGDDDRTAITNAIRGN